MPIDVTATLQKALGELEAEQMRLNQRITAVRNALELLSAAPTHSGKLQSRSNGRAKTRHVTAAQRSQISARMKRYWAKRQSQANGKGKRKAA